MSPPTPTAQELARRLRHQRENRWVTRGILGGRAAPQEFAPRLGHQRENRWVKLGILGGRGPAGSLELFLAGEMGEGGQLGLWKFSFRKYVFLRMSSRGFKMGVARRFGMQNYRFGRDLRFCKVIFKIEQGKFSGWGVPGTWVASWGKGGQLGIWDFSWRGAEGAPPRPPMV